MPHLQIQKLGFLEREPIDLTVQAGQCCCLLGPSGCGKTLLLRAVADLDPNSGDVFLGEQSRNAMSAPAWRSLVGFLPTQTFWWFETVAPHLTRVDQAALATLGFEMDVLHWQVDRLSSGEKQRLGLLRLLACEPQALLLDEPTASLDEASKQAVENLISQYMDQHDPEQVRRVSADQYQLTPIKVGL